MGTTYLVNVAAPEGLESDTVTAGGAATVKDAHSPVTAHGVESSEVTTFECLVCGGAFAELPFYGCCGGCYQSNETARALVDEAHPQTPVSW
jgi:hypothetical protein